MSRRHSAEKREVNPDPKYSDLVITKFMSAVMKEGKKSVAERIVYGAFERMETKGKASPVQLFHQALDNVMPAVEVRSRRVGGATLRSVLFSYRFNVRSAIRTNTKGPYLGLFAPYLERLCFLSATPCVSSTPRMM